MNQPRHRRHGTLECLAAAILFGLTTPLAAELLDHSSPATLAGLLYLGAALGTAPAALRKPPDRPTRHDRTKLAVAVILGGGIGPLLVLTALDTADAATVSVLLNFELAATAAIAHLIYREHIGRRTTAGIICIIAGGATLTWAGTPNITTAALLVTAACLCWGADNATTAHLTSYHPARITATKGTVAGLANLTLGLALAGGTIANPATVTAALAVGAVGYGASITLWIRGARRIGAAPAQALFATAPFIGAAAAWPINGTTPTLRICTAAAITATGVHLATTARTRRGTQTSSTEQPQP